MITTPGQINTAIFDFDNTLYQTERLKGKFYAMAEIHGYTRKEARDIYDRARIESERIVINLSSYLVVLREQVQRDGRTFLSEEVSEIIEKVKLGSNVVPYANELLRYYAQQGIEMYLLSLGVREWQEEKVQQSNIDRYFKNNHIIYTDRIDGGKIGIIKDILGSTNQTGKGCVIFNDKPEETRAMLDAFSDSIAFVRREPLDDRYSELNFDILEKEYPGRVVWSEDLKELLRLSQLLIQKT
jgi:phosphoserine phosphatase